MKSILLKTTIATFVFFNLINTQAQTAQKIGDNPTLLDNSAVLEIQSTKKGLLPPRMTEAQRGDINLPATGLVIYNLTSKRLEVWDGAAWSAGDNLGNHTATTNLEMSGKNITNVYEITTNHQLIVKDRETTNTTTFNLYKNAGKFNIWSQPTSDALSINETTGKTTLTSAAIAKGTDGATPAAGQVATAADGSGNIVWKSITTPLPLPSLTIVDTPTNLNEFPLPNNGGPVIIRSSASLSIDLPKNPPTSTYYTIINQMRAGIAYLRLQGTTFYLDDVEYANNKSFILTNINGAPNNILKIWHAGNNRWYTFP